LPRLPVGSGLSLGGIDPLAFDDLGVEFLTQTLARD
jgi:hypothetical protein